MPYNFPSICLAGFLLGGLGSVVGFAYEPVSAELEEKRAALIREIETFVEPSLGKEIVASGETSDFILVPGNYGVGRRGEEHKRRGGLVRVKRSVEYSVRIGQDDMSWQRSRVKRGNREIRKDECGFDGERRIVLGWQPGKPPVASITCGPVRRPTRGTAPEFVAGLRLLYSTGNVDFAGDGKTPALLLILKNSDEIIDGETVDGLGEVTVARMGTTKCYLRRSPVTHCVGCDKVASDAIVRLRIEYRSNGSSVVPIGCKRTVLLRAPDGSKSIASHAEAKFSDVAFKDLQSPESFLPAIPDGTRVRDNCSFPKEAATRPASKNADSRWLWILPLAALAVLGRQVVNNKLSGAIGCPSFWL